MPGVDQNKPIPRWQAGDWLFRLAVPLCIAAGAVLKLLTSRPEHLPGFNLVPELSPGMERLAGVLLPLVVLVELTLAALIAFHRGFGRRLAIGLLALFCLVLSAQIAGNAASCGCFGAFHTDPTMMLITDAVGIGLILLLPAAPQRHTLRNARWGAIAGTTLSAAFFVAVITGFSIPERQGWRIPIEKMHPEQWVGQPLAETTVGRFVEGGLPTYPEREQTWVLWIRTCPFCHELFRTTYGQPTTERVIALEVPLGARGVSSTPHEIECPSCVRLSLRAGRFYILPETPVVLRVVDGVVRRVEIKGEAVK
jgi:hypothetical protein